MNSEVNKTEVMIGVARPTGLVAAIELARRGIGVRIIDKVLPRPYSESRAEGIHAKTLEIFERIGILPHLFQQGKILRGFSFFANGKQLGRIGFKGLASPHPHAILMPQSEIERILTEHLAVLGVTIERPVEVTAVRQDSTTTFASLLYLDGYQEEVAAAYLLAADGGHSTIRKQLGLDFPGHALQGAYVMDAEAEFGVALPADEGNFVLGSRGFLVLGLRPDGLWRIALSLPQSDQRMKREAPTLVQMQQIFDDDFPQLRARLKSTSWASAFFLSSRIISRLRVGRIFLVGDAAHIHSPVGGQGMNTGIQDAVNLAWKLAVVLRLKGEELSQEALLDSYQTERYPVMRRLIQVTNASTKLILVSNPLLVKLRNLALATLTKIPPIQTKLISDFTGFAVHYPTSPVISYKAKAKRLRPGQLAPDVASLVTPDGKTRRWYELWGSDTRHQLLIFAGEREDKTKLAQVKALQEELAANYGEFIQPHLIINQTGFDPMALIDRYGEMHQRYGLADGGLCLVRPDGYISFISPSSNSHELYRYLENLFGQVSQPNAHQEPALA